MARTEAAREHLHFQRYAEIGGKGGGWWREIDFLSYVTSDFTPRSHFPPSIHFWCRFLNKLGIGSVYFYLIRACALITAVGEKSGIPRDSFGHISQQTMEICLSGYPPNVFLI